MWKNRENFVSFSAGEQRHPIYAGNVKNAWILSEKRHIQNVNFENLYIPVQCISVLLYLKHKHYAECDKKAALLLKRIYSTIKIIKELADE